MSQAGKRAKNGQIKNSGIFLRLTPTLNTKLIYSEQNILDNQFKRQHWTQLCTELKVYTSCLTCTTQWLTSPCGSFVCPELLSYKLHGNRQCFKKINHIMLTTYILVHVLFVITCNIQWIRFTLLLLYKVLLESKQE